MNTDATGALEEIPLRYPLIFRAYDNLKRYPREPIAHWRFECGPGWARIIEEIAEWLEPQAVKQKAAGKRAPMVVQVKEKFGSIRFYVRHIPPALRGEFAKRETLAVMLSVSTCEVCGGPGKHRVDGWHRTLCDAHERELQLRQSGTGDLQVEE